MHPHGSPLAQQGLGQIIPDPHFIDPVPCFVDNRKQGAVYAAAIVGGNPHILVVEIGGKGMGAD